jgi:hypothetical protein
MSRSINHRKAKEEYLTQQLAMTHGANTDNKWIKERIEMTPIKKNMLNDIKNNKYFSVSDMMM